MEKGKKRLAVLVGCNYPNTQFRLRGCINDVVAMKEVLEKRFSFDPKNVQLLTDAPGSSVIPTGANIKAALDEMVNQAEAGDVLFFHFSGHGTTIPSLEPGQAFMQDEAIVPCDLNLITDLDMRQLIKQLPEGSSFTILSDSCHSGGLIDKDKEQIGPSTAKGIGVSSSIYQRSRGLSLGTIFDCIHSVSQTINTVSEVASTIDGLLTGIFGKDVSLTFRPQREKDLVMKSLNEEEGILLSGCQSNEKSADLDVSLVTRGKAHGAFTYTLLEILENEESQGGLSNRQLVTMARKVLKEYGFEQHPCLYSSNGNADATFLGIPKPSNINHAH